MMRPLLLAVVLGGLLTGCSKSKPGQSLAAPTPPPLPPHLANPPLPDQLARQGGRLPAGTPSIPRDIKMPPRPDLSQLPPPPKDFVLPPLPPGAKWPAGNEQPR